MTDKQFDKIIKMVRMILDGCKDLEEAKQKVEEIERMNMTENARLALGLRALGMNDKEIVNFLLWIETGEEQYKPKAKEE